MNIVFFGTPVQAQYIVSGLYDKGVEVKACITQPDRPVKRSSQPVPPPVKAWALEREIPVYQPQKLSDPEFVDLLRSFNADCFVVTAYGAFLPQVVLDIPKLGCINVHPSLLPKYRGAAPIPWSIIQGDKETGVSIMAMVKKMDAGDVFACQRLAIGENETADDLEKRIWPLGVDLMYRVLEDAYSGSLNPSPQDESKVSFAPKFTPENTKIDWKKSGLEIHNLIRGLCSKPAAWSEILIKGQLKRVKLFTTRFAAQSHQFETGILRLSSVGELEICCEGGVLTVKEWQVEGKKRMNSSQFLRGVSIKDLSLVLT